MEVHNLKAFLALVHSKFGNFCSLIDLLITRIGLENQNPAAQNCIIFMHLVFFYSCIWYFFSNLAGPCEKDIWAMSLENLSSGV